MNWKLKASVLKRLSQFPGGRYGYLKIQKLLGTTKVNPRRDLTRAVEIIQLIHESGQQVEEADCFEIGTGWHPFLPLGLYLAGARSIITVDVNPWLSLSSCRQTVGSASQHLDWFAEQIGLPAQTVRQRYHQIQVLSHHREQLLESMRTRYIYPGDAQQTGLPGQSIDFVISSNVLEHIPPSILENICAESLRILQPGGLAVHRFNPGDHYANDDKRITTVNFLQYTEEDWKKYGAGLAYHNRLRTPEYSRLFAAAGFLGLIENIRIEQRAWKALQAGFQVAPQFAQYSAEELAADYMWYVGMKPTAVTMHPAPAELPRKSIQSYERVH